MQFFVQTPFSHSNIKQEQKKFTPENLSPFRYFLMQRHKITTQIGLKNQGIERVDFKKKHGQKSSGSDSKEQTNAPN